MGAPEPPPPQEDAPHDPPPRQAKEEAKQSGPLEAILHMPPPAEVRKQHPSMSPPPYMHHFDTYSLVKQLQSGGFSEAHSVTAMKGIRSLLAQNLDVAQASLVSKSDVENVSQTQALTARDGATKGYRLFVRREMNANWVNRNRTFSGQLAPSWGLR
jgi:hypothetical protein